MDTAIPVESLEALGRDEAEQVKHMICDALLLPVQNQEEREDADPTVTLATAEREQRVKRFAVQWSERGGNRLLPNALPISGVKHTCDNALTISLHCMDGWKVFLEQIRSLQEILKPRWTRERLQSSCLDKFPEESKLLDSWTSSLKGLRWHAIVAFLSELSNVEEVLRKRWNAKAFKAKCKSDQSKSEGTMAYIDQASVVVADAYFWAYSHMVLKLGSIEDHISHWSEGCPCPQHSRSKEDDETRGNGWATCAFKGCRAAELACGFVQVTVPLLLREAQYYIVGIMNETGLDALQSHALLQDWQSGSSCLQLQLMARTAYWGMLPWRLCGVAHHNVLFARECAQRCLGLWMKMSEEQRRRAHPITRRYLDPNWEGLPNCSDDVPLREFLISFAHGQSFSELPKAFSTRVYFLNTARQVACRHGCTCDHLLFAEVGSVRMIKVVERSTEGKHSIMTKGQRSAPAAFSAS